MKKLLAISICLLLGACADDMPKKTVVEAEKPLYVFPILELQTDPAMAEKKSNDVTVYFKFDSAVTNDKNVVLWAANYMKEKPDAMLSIYGYTDRIGDKHYNQKLAFRRANGIKNLLVKLGVDENRIYAEGVGISRSVECGQVKVRELIACLQPDRKAILKINQD